MSGHGNAALGELSDENQRLRDLIQQRNHEIVRLTTELRSQPSGFDAASSRERTATAQPRYWSPDEHERFLQVGQITEPESCLSFWACSDPLGILRTLSPQGLNRYGPKAFKSIATFVGTRTATQVGPPAGVDPSFAPHHH
jgi:hypothetical protein